MLSDSGACEIPRVANPCHPIRPLVFQCIVHSFGLLRTQINRFCVSLSMSRPERTKPLGNRAPSDRPALLNRRPSRSLPGASSSSKPPRDTTSAAQVSTSSSGRSLTSSKPARTSKTTQKLVLLPEQPQTLPLPTLDEDDAHGYETDAGVKVREHKSVGERMSKSERRKAGYRRITALKVCQSFKMKLLASFLKREHNVTPRAYDDALYVVRLHDVVFTVLSNACSAAFRCTTFPSFPVTVMA